VPMPICITTKRAMNWHRNFFRPWSGEVFIIHDARPSASPNSRFIPYCSYFSEVRAILAFEIWYHLSRYVQEMEPTDAHQTWSLPDVSRDILVNRELERSAVRKLDDTILPMLSLFYLLSFLVSLNLLPMTCLTVSWKDRANIGLLFWQVWTVTSNEK